MVLFAAPHFRYYNINLFSLLYHGTVDRKGIIYEVENNWLPTHANILCNVRHSKVQKLSNKQSARVICRFDRLRTPHRKRQTSHMSIGKLSATHAFYYVVLRVKPGLTSFEDHATVLTDVQSLTVITYIT